MRGLRSREHTRDAVAPEPDFATEDAPVVRRDRPYQMPVEKGCPLDCGLCTDHEQHTCLAIVEITEACNLRCPTCFADSDVGRCAPLDEVERMLDTIVANEGYADVVQLSGGEPTIHPQILEIVT